LAILAPVWRGFVLSDSLLGTFLCSAGGSRVLAFFCLGTEYGTLGRLKET